MKNQLLKKYLLCIFITLIYYLFLIVKILKREVDYSNLGEPHVITFFKLGKRQWLLVENN